MALDFDDRGLLPAGIHRAALEEVVTRFGWNGHRRRLILGLKEAARSLAAAGCTRIYLDGSFVTAKERPRDYEVVWDPTGVDLDRLDPVFFDFADERAAQKARYGGEFFPIVMIEGAR